MSAPTSAGCWTRKHLEGNLGARLRSGYVDKCRVVSIVDREIDPQRRRICRGHGDYNAEPGSWHFVMSFGVSCDGPLNSLDDFVPSANVCVDSGALLIKEWVAPNGSNWRLLLQPVVLARNSLT